jgi:hypothetical protein
MAFYETEGRRFESCLARFTGRNDPAHVHTFDALRELGRILLTSSGHRVPRSVAEDERVGAGELHQRRRALQLRVLDQFALV